MATENSLSASNAIALVGVVIVNYRNWQDTRRCLTSLYQSSYPRFAACVVDNGNSPHNERTIAQEFPKASFIWNTVNKGFAEGCNQGLNHVISEGAELVWLLNSDTEVTTDALQALVGLAEANPSVSFFGSLITHRDGETVWFGGGDYDWRVGSIRHRDFGRKVQELELGAVRRCHWITGCSLLTRAAYFQQRGGLREDFFLYREDFEWQLRVGLREPRALLLCRPLVRHKVGATTGSTRSLLGAVFMSRNFLKLCQDYRPPLRWLATWFGEAIVRPALRGRIRVAIGGVLGLVLIKTHGSRIVEWFRRA
jgi:GT2 family glycosyltransferase